MTYEAATRKAIVLWVLFAVVVGIGIATVAIPEIEGGEKDHIQPPEGAP